MAAVIAHSVAALLAIKLFGGSYFIYHGVKVLRSRPSGAVLLPETKMPCPSGARSIVMGFLGNALNPKAPIYFVSLFTVVLSPDMPVYQIALYGLWMMLIQMLWFSLVALLLFLFLPPSVALEVFFCKNRSPKKNWPPRSGR